MTHAVGRCLPAPSWGMHSFLLFKVTSLVTKCGDGRIRTHCESLLLRRIPSVTSGWWPQSGGEPGMWPWGLFRKSPALSHWLPFTTGDCDAIPFERNGGNTTTSQVLGQGSVSNLTVPTSYLGILLKSRF